MSYGRYLPAEAFENRQLPAEMANVWQSSMGVCGAVSARLRNAGLCTRGTVWGSAGFVGALPVVATAGRLHAGTIGMRMVPGVWCG